MDDIDKYSRLGLTELLEFTARLGVLIYKERPQMSLVEKIESVLIELFKIVNEKVKYPPKTEDDEMISDFEDDILVHARRKFKEDNHEGFCIVDITKSWNDLFS